MFCEASDADEMQTQSILFISVISLAGLRPFLYHYLPCIKCGISSYLVCMYFLVIAYCCSLVANVLTFQIFNGAHMEIITSEFPLLSQIYLIEFPSAPHMKHILYCPLCLSNKGFWRPFGLFLSHPIVGFSLIFYISWPVTFMFPSM